MYTVLFSVLTQTLTPRSQIYALCAKNEFVVFSKFTKL